jgi:uncharacterized spore protein YtfJ
MTDDQMDTAREHAQDMASKVPGLLEGLAEKIGANAGAKAVFGEPVREGGRTVIPVAQSVVGTGAGGGGSQDDAAGSGLGAGGGALTRPLGYIEVTAASAEFVPLRRAWADPKLVLAYATIVLIVSRSLVKLIRG